MRRRFAKSCNAVALVALVMTAATSMRRSACCTTNFARCQITRRPNARLHCAFSPRSMRATSH